MKNNSREKYELAMRLAPLAAAMVREDKAKTRDGGSCAIGAGIAAYLVPPRCRAERLIVLVDQPFQGDAPSHTASRRAIEWLRSEGVDAFWHAGRVD